MKKWILLLFGCLIGISGCVKESESEEYIADEEKEVIRLVNNERAKAGIALLEMDISLHAISGPKSLRSDSATNARTESPVFRLSHSRARLPAKILPTDNRMQTP